MHLMEIKLPSKSQAVFYEMQNELLALQQSKDTEKTCVCYFGAFCSHLTGLHSSLSWAEEMLKVWDDSLMENALLLSLPPWATAYRLHCEVSHRYLFLVLSCLQRNPCTSAKIVPLKSSAETGNAEIAKLFSYRAQTAAGQQQDLTSLRSDSAREQDGPFLCSMCSFWLILMAQFPNPGNHSLINKSKPASGWQSHATSYMNRLL